MPTHSNFPLILFVFHFRPFISHDAASLAPPTTNKMSQGPHGETFGLSEKQQQRWTLCCLHGADHRESVVRAHGRLSGCSTHRRRPPAAAAAAERKWEPGRRSGQVVHTTHCTVHTAHSTLHTAPFLHRLTGGHKMPLQLGAQIFFCPESQNGEP